MRRNSHSLMLSFFITLAVLALSASSAAAQANADALLKDAFAQMSAGAEKNDAAITASGLDLLRKFAQETPSSHKMKKHAVATLAWLDKMRATEQQLAQEAEAQKAADPNRTYGAPNIMGGRPLKFIRPDYPPLAREANALGKVPVQIEVGEDGKVIRVLSVSGHPLLQQAAAEAALKHQFAPTVINGAPSKAQGTLKFTF